MISCAFNGQPGYLTRGDVPDNITVTWLTNTVLSGGRLYCESKGAVSFTVKGGLQRSLR